MQTMNNNQREGVAVMAHPEREFVVMRGAMPHTAESEELAQLRAMTRTPETVALNAALVVVAGPTMRDLRFVTHRGSVFENYGTPALLHPQRGFVVMPGDSIPYSPLGGEQALREVLIAGGFLSFEGFRFVWPEGHNADTIERLLAL